MVQKRLSAHEDTRRSETDYKCGSDILWFNSVTFYGSRHSSLAVESAEISSQEWPDSLAAMSPMNISESISKELCIRLILVAKTPSELSVNDV